MPSSGLQVPLAPPPSAYTPLPVAPGYTTRPGATVPQGPSAGSQAFNSALQTQAATGDTTSAAIAGGSTLVSALLGNKGQKKAVKEQQRANTAAEQVAREQMAEDKRRYEEQQALTKAQWDAMEARKDPWRRALAQRFGIPFPASTPQVAAPLAMTPAATSGAPQWAGSAYPTKNSSPLTLGGMAGMSAPPPVEAPKLTLADLGNWNKWGSPQG